MYIYALINKINNKIYIGYNSSNHDIYHNYSRPQQHLVGKTKCKLIQSAINKYGKENFIILKVHSEQHLTLDKLKELEIYYIKHFNTLAPNGYNLTKGGDGLTGFKQSEEQRLKNSEALKLSHSRLEIKKKISDSLKGRIGWNKGLTKATDFRIKKLSDSSIVAQNRPEQKKKLSETKVGDKNPNYKKHPSAETRRRLSESQVIAQNNPELKLFHSNLMKLRNHNKYHFDQGVLNLDCRCCLDAIMKEHS